MLELVAAFHPSNKLQSNTASLYPETRERKTGKKMRVSTVTTLAVLSVQFLSLTQADERLARKRLVAEEVPAASAKASKILDLSHAEGRGVGVRRQPSTRLQKETVEDVREGGGILRKVVSKPQLGTNKQKAGSKKQAPRLSPPKSKSQGLQHHLKGHGKFNTETYSCPGIQSKACKKPSDCDGCLGLYTCKLPRGKCDLKAVSRKTGTT
ncbi:uncharacterized protein LOC128326903 isoform X2 [Hemicordylus capensis]|uniref:uncharacterized protein LOC128326903 isoform X2 n=1 Tax=Hemicordylus capensis TaxID=884348 RepID=UPI0023040012|nr:uncharacterized protein LOC128326903 isoform X2 [Hemicordylus capensis]